MDNTMNLIVLVIMFNFSDIHPMSREAQMHQILNASVEPFLTLSLL